MNRKAYYGEFGGQYVAESLMNTLEELYAAFEEAIRNPEFLKQYHYYLKQYVGRETPLYYAERLSEAYGTKIYLKREDLNHTGAHKINVLVACGQTCKTVPKISSIYYFAPGAHTEGDGYLYQNRSLSDVFVFPNGKDGKIDSIFVDVDTTEYTEG